MKKTCDGTGLPKKKTKKYFWKRKLLHKRIELSKHIKTIIPEFFRVTKINFSYCYFALILAISSNNRCAGLQVII